MVHMLTTETSGGRPSYCWNLVQAQGWNLQPKQGEAAFEVKRLPEHLRSASTYADESELKLFGVPPFTYFERMPPLPAFAEVLILYSLLSYGA